MGMEGAEGMTAEQLDNRDFLWTESVLTADISQRLKDGKPLYGRRLGNGDEEDYRVGGVIAPVRYRSYMQPMPIELYVYEEFPDYMYYYIPLIALRIDDHLSEKVFLHHFREWMNKELTVGNYYVKSVQSFSDIQESDRFPVLLPQAPEVFLPSGHHVSGRLQNSRCRKEMSSAVYLQRSYH
jgi:putative ABC transport system permease protein